MTDTLITAAADERGLLDHLQLIADNLRLLILGPILIGVLGLGIAYLIPPTFSARVLFIPPKQQQNAAAAALSDLSLLGGAAGAIAGVKNPADQYAALARSRSIADVLIGKFNLHTRYDKRFHEETRKELAENTRISVGAKDGLITLEVDDTDPMIAASICNAYVEELRNLLNRVALTEAQQRRVFFEKQVQDAKTALVRAELSLRESGVDSSALKVSSTAALEGVARLKAQISVQEVKIASMRGYLADSAPDLKQAQVELSALRGQMERSDKGDAPREGQGDYVTRYREFKYQETLVAMYMRQFELARVDESREGAIIQVVDVATAPERKSKPKKAIIAVLTALTAFVLLLVYVFLRRSLRVAMDDPNSGEKVKRLSAALRFGPG